MSHAVFPKYFLVKWVSSGAHVRSYSPPNFQKTERILLFHRGFLSPIDFSLSRRQTRFSALESLNWYPRTVAIATAALPYISATPRLPLRAQVGFLAFM